MDTDGLDDLRERLASIRADPDPERAYAAASAMWRAVQDLTGEIAGVRAEAAIRIRDARMWNLSELGRHLGVSPQRAQQWQERVKGDRHELPGSDGAK